MAVAVAIPLAGCAALSPPRIAVPPGPRGLNAVSPEERARYIQAAQVWRPIDTASLDLFAGPPGDDAFAFEQAVTCDYAPPEKRPEGMTPKFYCELAPKDRVKVKYGAANREVYGEVAGTRLFWALGFGTDRQYPVKVSCRNCPPDPWKHPAPATGTVQPFDPAIIERSFPGKDIVVRGSKKGWAWWELSTVDERAGGAPRAQVDALRLLAAFVQHGDNQDTQQRLACLPDGVQRGADGGETCTRPFLSTVDLGGTFSRSTLLFIKKVDLESWSRVPVWKDRRRCIARLSKNLFTGTMANPRIGEPGRAFLAGLLARLSDRQIHELFAAARVERLGGTIKDDHGHRRSATVDDWVRVFVRKRTEITEARCPGA